MTSRDSPLTVYYDGACPGCVADRRRYERLAGKSGASVHWLDITGREELLRQSGIDPAEALRSLHVEDANGTVHRELDAYILLMSRVPLLKPAAWLVGLPVIRPMLSKVYRHWVDRRLYRSGRYPE